ncbi:hypothetical protein CASFOL_008287 [Castilleja foliolosa]|uniref:Uncharacterized protein n=1 Tax=Castilleja foliolosa TaxID=1961234 RepID=A0ABD3E2P2_9LAMI
MSLRRSRSESEIINHKTDKDYGLAMKSNNEDTTFQRISAPPVKGSLFGPPVGIFSGPDENKAHTSDMEKIASQRNPRQCGACGGMHEFFACPLRTMCKFDQEVPEDYEVVCACSDCFCPGRCGFPFGRVRVKNPVMAFKFF